jgi:hypothetical protein
MQTNLVILLATNIIWIALSFALWRSFRKQYDENKWLRHTKNVLIKRIDCANTMVDVFREESPRWTARYEAVVKERNQLQQLLYGSTPHLGEGANPLTIEKRVITKRVKRRGSVG